MDTYDHTIAAEETENKQAEPDDSVGQFSVRIDMLMSTLKKFYIEGMSAFCIHKRHLIVVTVKQWFYKSSILGNQLDESLLKKSLQKSNLLAKRKGQHLQQRPSTDRKSVV